MAVALIGLGANLGRPEEQLKSALEHLAERRTTLIVGVSRFYETSPIGGPSGQPRFLNGAALIETQFSPGQLLERCKAIETELGRTRLLHWGARSIDLDVLLYDEQIVRDPQLAIPHPRMSFRRFVLEPACEIAADMVHPECGCSLGELKEILDTAPHYIAISEGERAELGTIVEQVLQDLAAPWIPNSTELTPSDLLDPARWHRHEQLRPCLEAKPDESMVPAISSFWVHDTPHPFTPEKSPLGLPPFVQPRLVVRYDPLQQIDQTFSDTFRTLGRAPLLRIHTLDIATWETELSAAIAAMGPLGMMKKGA